MKYGVGIDVSKGKSTVAIISLSGEVIEMPFEIYHDVDGLELLRIKIKELPKDSLKFVLEATGTYHLPILSWLIENEYYVTVENALKIKKYFDRDLRKAKTDKKDALKLAEYCCDNWYKLNQAYENDEIYNKLQFLSRQYLTAMAIQTKEKINFSNLCDLLFPGYYQLLNENNFDIGLKVFEKFYHPSLVCKKKQPQFIKEVDKIAKDLGHKTAGISLANKIYELAASTISPYPNDECTQIIAMTHVKALTISIKASKDIITKMDEIASTLPEYSEIKSMDGVGKKLTPRLIAEIGDIRRFKNAGSLIAYAGLDSPPYQSGQYEATHIHISKRGNKYLRKTGYETMKAIKTSCKSGSILYDYMIKKELEGKAKKCAKIAALNKFLRMYYGKVKHKYIELGIWNQ